MTVTFDLVDLILFIVVAFIAGSAASSLMYRRRANPLFNTLLGIVGAFIGAFIFRALDLDLPAELSQGVSLAEIIIAFFGALILLVIAGLLRRA